MTTRWVRACPLLLVLLTIIGLALHSLATDRAAVASASVQSSEVAGLSSLKVLDDALAQGRIDVAVRSWDAAYRAAFASRQWKGMADVGDAALMISASSETRSAWRARARQSYLMALYRARATGSVDGILRVGTAFHALGDRDVAAMCLRTAEDVAARRNDQADRAKIRRFAELVGMNPASPRP